MKRICAIVLLLLIATASSAQLDPQPKKMTEKFFPDPDITINTPAFQKKRGFTDHEELVAFTDALIAAHPDVVTRTSIGTSQKGKDITMIRINRPNGDQNKVRVWLQGGLHGDEPASTEGILFLLDKLLNDPASTHLLDSLELAVVPMANVDGYEKQSRYAANGLDLNRDQTKLAAPETVYLKAAFEAFKPEVAVDFHEYRAFRRDFAKLSTYGVANKYDVMFLYSSNLNVPESLRAYTQDRFVANARKTMDEAGLTHHDYFSTGKHFGALYFSVGARSSRSSATAYALTNCVASLIEVRGVALGRTSFTRRVHTTFLVALDYLSTAYANRAELRNAIAKAGKERIPEAVVSTTRPAATESISFIDVETNELIDIEAMVRRSENQKPKLTRPFPYGYIILPEGAAAAEKLRQMGMEVHTLSSPIKITAEAYHVETYKRDTEKTEGVFRQEVTTAVSPTELTLPEGTFVVYLDEIHAGLAVEVLEPEADNSFVSFSIIETSEGSVLPIYRYMTPTKL